MLKHVARTENLVPCESAGSDLLAEGGEHFGSENLPPVSDSYLRKAEHLILECLGPENCAFMSAMVGGGRNPSPALLDLLSHLAKTTDDEDLNSSVSKTHRLLADITDFTKRLEVSAIGKTSPAIDNGSTSSGESVKLIQLSIAYMFEELEQLTPALRNVGSKLAVRRVSDQSEMTSASLEKTVSGSLPPLQRDNSEPLFDSKDKKDLVSHILSPLLLLSKIGANALVLAKDALSCAIELCLKPIGDFDETRRPKLQDGEPSTLSLIRRFIGGTLLDLMQKQMGLLSPRLERSRYAQVGGEDNPDTGKGGLNEVLGCFLNGLGRLIKSYFKSSPHVRGQVTDSFYMKEVEVLVDNEGRYQRLDEYLQRTKQGRELFDVIYQPMNVSSHVSESEEGRIIVTIPVAPLLTTSLPTPPQKAIEALEYLNSKGDRIADQHTENQIRACVAGGAIIHAPSGARMVRYSLVDRCAEYGPRPLSADEYTKVVEVLPHVSFDLGEFYGLVYRMINQFQDPLVRLGMVAGIEAKRGWIYTKSRSLASIHSKTGDGFLEAIYHSRTGICDSMSSVGAFLYGKAVGLPGLVVTGLCQRNGYFDLSEGHTLNGALLQDGIATWDLTRISSVDNRVTGKSVPQEIMDQLSEQVSNNNTPMRQFVNLLDDISYLVRGEVPKRYLPVGETPANPQVHSWWRTHFLAPGRYPSPPPYVEHVGQTLGDFIVLAVLNAAKALYLDNVYERCIERNDASELLWFAREILPPPSSDMNIPDNIICSEWKRTAKFDSIVRRDLHQEITERIISAFKNGIVPQHELDRVSTSIWNLAYKQRLAIAEVSGLAARSPKEFKDIVVNLLFRFPEQILQWKGNQQVQQAELLINRLVSLADEAGNDFYESERWLWQGVLTTILETPCRLGLQLIPEERSKLSCSFARLLRSIGRHLGDSYAFSVCEALGQMNGHFYQIDHFEPALRKEIRSALGADAADGSERLADEVYRYLTSSPKSFESVQNSIKRILDICPELSLADYAEKLYPLISNLTRTFIERHLHRNSSLDPYLINWPDSEHPASSLLSKCDRWSGVDFLGTLVASRAISEDQAKSLWPKVDERQLIVRFLRHANISSGKIEAVGMTWRLCEMPLLLERIAVEYSCERLGELVREVVQRRRMEGQLFESDDQRHFLKILDFTNGIPAVWGPACGDWEFASAVAELICGPLSAAEFFRIIHDVAPHFIRPAEANRDEAYLKNLEEFQLFLVSNKDIDPNLYFEDARRTFTKRSPRRMRSDAERALAAASWFEAAALMDMNISDAEIMPSDKPGFGLVNSMVRDDGSCPDGQIWRAHFSEQFRTEVNCRLSGIARQLFQFFAKLDHNTQTLLLSHVLTFQVGGRRIGSWSQSGETIDARPYVAGDSSRDIDWKRSCRSGSDQLLVRRRIEKEDRYVSLVVDLTVLAEEFSQLNDALDQNENNKDLSISNILRAAPAFSTIVHETVAAHKNGLKVDLFLTHHALIREMRNFGLTMEQEKSAEIVNLKKLVDKAELLDIDEEEILGFEDMLTVSPFEHNEIDLKKDSLVILLLSKPSMRATFPIIPQLRAKGHVVAEGALRFGNERKISGENEPAP